MKNRDVLTWPALGSLQCIRVFRNVQSFMYFIPLAATRPVSLILKVLNKHYSMREKLCRSLFNCPLWAAVACFSPVSFAPEIIYRLCLFHFHTPALLCIANVDRYYFRFRERKHFLFEIIILHFHISSMYFTQVFVYNLWSCICLTNALYIQLRIKLWESTDSD